MKLMLHVITMWQRAAELRLKEVTCLSEEQFEYLTTGVEKYLKEQVKFKRKNSVVFDKWRDNNCCIK